jgi:ribosomal protein L37AE/L43A
MCYNKYMNKNNERICPVCKKSFYKKIYKKCHAIYCCQKCAYKGRTLGFTMPCPKESPVPLGRGMNFGRSK